MPDFFSLFSLPKNFSIDEKELERNYFALQRQYHPDKFVAGTASERIAALNKSTEITNAYQVLSNPLKRAEYLLAEHNIRVNGENDNVKPSHELLMEIMEIREKLSEAEARDLKNLEAFAETEIKESIGRLAKDFAGNELEKAAEDAMRLKYLTKFLDEIKLKKRSVRPL